MLHWGDWWNYLNSFSSIRKQIIKYSTCIKRGKVLSKSFPSRIIFQFFSFLMKKTQGGYQAIFIWSKINNLMTVKWFSMFNSLQVISHKGWGENIWCPPCDFPQSLGEKCLLAIRWVFHSTQEKKKKVGKTLVAIKWFLSLDSWKKKKVKKAYELSYFPIFFFFWFKWINIIKWPLGVLEPSLATNGKMHGDTQMIFFSFNLELFFENSLCSC
jgi:hypothetical protein